MGIVVVTGAAGALGGRTAALLSEAGWTVAGLDLAEISYGGLALSLGGVNLSDQQQVETAIAQVTDRLGGLDGLVNIAGGFAWETVGDGSIDTWDRLFDVNLRTALTVSRAALPMLRSSKGSIVNIGAAASARAGAGMGAYAASKACVSRLTEALAEEVKDDGVRVNAVLPSIIDTPANRADMPQADFSRWVSVEAIGHVIAFLLSPAASDVTGALVPVTGRV